ncbi:LysE family translocator [Desulfovibrio sp. JC010]|uniref:LysE family translocator n=1 Tax=Desulfovibrio sp. JC010 TaxID=2593641 RepID=UPI0013D6AB39|nr:LysE family translocator [Desulfovibrio sp. JC010]NDV25228.1 LysE family translocator [Desulfovibrio sp. JC010]
MLETVFTLLTICFFARMSPGPDMMLLIHHAGCAPSSSGRGFFRGSSAAYGCIIGVCMGLTFHVSLSVLGLALVLKSHPFIYNAVRYAGAFYLLYIGYRCFTDNGGLELEGSAENCTGSTFMQGLRDGLFCNLLNPKVTLFILSVFMQLVGPDAALGEKAVYGSVIVLEAFFGWGLFVLFLNTSIVQRIYGEYVSLINKITGTILFLLGGYIFFS